MSHCRHDHDEAGGGHDNCDHSHSHGGHEHQHDVEDPAGASLFGLIDTTRVRCLNEGAPGAVLNCLKPWDQREEPEPNLRSNEDDPQLIIHVPFTQVVKLKGICVAGGREGAAPARMKVWVNRDDIDFSNAEDLPAVQTIEMVDGDGGGARVVDYPTKLNKMQNVSSITLYVPENFGADETVISFLGFKGENTRLRHGIVECVYESKPQPADHKAPGENFIGHSIT